jgi:hypothetical protein
MEEIRIKHENPDIGSMLLLNGLQMAGLIIKTKWGWKAKIKSIEPAHFNQGQGVSIVREIDGYCFSIHPSEIQYICK